MSKKLKKQLERIIVAIILFAAGMLLPFPDYKGFDTAIIFLLAAYLTAGYDIILKAIRNIGHGQVFDENFLMTIATFAAFGTGEIPEGAMVMVLYQIGEWFQQYAVGKSRTSITELMDIRPDYANVKRDGEIITVDPDEVENGEIIVVKPGEKVALDGIVVKGESYLDTSALTGESLPRKIGEGEEILSGFINRDGLLEIRTTKGFEESTVSKVLELVENASSRKAKAENFITKFARYYTPIVVIGALVLAILPPLLGSSLGFKEWIIRACTFLVISCPCALVISVPLGFFGGIGGAAKEGILIKGSNFMETLSKINTVVFDKTGTITKGNFTVTKIVPAMDKSGDSKDSKENQANQANQANLLRIAALAENFSEHPIAQSLKSTYEAKGEKIDGSQVSDTKDFSGKGIRAIIDGEEVYVGNDKIGELAGVKIPKTEELGTIVHVAKNGQYLGYILISDEIKPESKEAMTMLKQMGIDKLVMLTGDMDSIAQKVACEVGVDKAYAQLLPGDKVDKIEEIIKDETSNGKRKNAVAFVGDGINDAPVLSRVDVGIAMGGLGSDAAIEAADVVIMDDKLPKIATAIGISKRTLRIVRQNIVFALAIKATFLVLGALGLANLWEAVFADVGVAFIAILNSMRALKVYPVQKKC